MCTSLTEFSVYMHVLFIACRRTVCVYNIICLFGGFVISGFRLQVQVHCNRTYHASVKGVFYIGLY